MEASRSWPPEGFLGEGELLAGREPVVVGNLRGPDEIEVLPQNHGIREFLINLRLPEIQPALVDPDVLSRGMRNPRSPARVLRSGPCCNRGETRC